MSLFPLLHGIAGLILDEQIPHEVLETVPRDALVRAALQVVREGLLAPITAPRDSRRARRA